jgi:hypothetical protein
VLTELGHSKADQDSARCAQKYAVGNVG